MFVRQGVPTADTHTQGFLLAREIAAIRAARPRKPAHHWTNIAGVLIVALLFVAGAVVVAGDLFDLHLLPAPAQSSARAALSLAGPASVVYQGLSAVRERRRAYHLDTEAVQLLCDIDLPGLLCAQAALGPANQAPATRLLQAERVSLPAPARRLARLTSRSAAYPTP
ncbi:hypothetical protein [Kitasatospora sp. NPDC051914]|uniref:hypothetical protein n=1 Tax=Kitasatospora sp. NPDC051914 TaxID=3154945 RepID=UPI0034366866